MKTILCVLSVTVAALSCVPAASADAFLAVRLAPPPLPVVSQPYSPGPGYIWTPGHWAYGVDEDDGFGGYYWVPGAWVLAPEPGLLWTPGYWAYDDGDYVWHAGYWGPQVGYYGGVDYGFGYPGVGYDGGYWSGSRFYYNQAVNHVDAGLVGYVYWQGVRHGRYDRDRRSYDDGYHLRRYGDRYRDSRGRDYGGDRYRQDNRRDAVHYGDRADRGHADGGREYSAPRRYVDRPETARQRVMYPQLQRPVLGRRSDTRPARAPDRGFDRRPAQPRVEVRQAARHQPAGQALRSRNAAPPHQARPSREREPRTLGRRPEHAPPR